MTIGHGTGHAPLTSPGNDEVDPLARVQRLDWAPPTNLAASLPHCLQHADVKIMWNVVKQWGLHLTWSGLVEACQECVVCTQEYPHPGALEPWLAR